jgi:hypothetical protein
MQLRTINTPYFNLCAVIFFKFKAFENFDFLGHDTVYIGYASPNFQQRHVLKDWELHEYRCGDFKYCL